MSDNVAVFPRFFAIINHVSLVRDKMKLPGQFISKHGEILPETLKLEASNGFETTVTYKKSKGKIYGTYAFFDAMEFANEIATVFEYVGNGVFKVYVFDVKYQDVRRRCVGFGVSAEGSTVGGELKFISMCVNSRACDRGLVAVPSGQVLPRRLSVCLPNGQVFEASYSSATRLISGLRIYLLNDVLMLTYRGNGAFDLVLFDHSNAEKTFSAYAWRVGAMVGIAWREFKIEIQPFHLYPYCYGIDISVDYKAVTDMWPAGQHLTVYYKGNYFFLEIRKTDRRWKLHEGWVRFSRLLGLAVGDVLVFNMTDSPIKFSLEVYRSEERHD